MGRNMSLNGLRGLALLLIYTVHFNFGGWPENQIEKYTNFNWIAVDLFFVLSGYFISNLISKHNKDVNGYLYFTINRFLRVAPVYYVSLIALLAFPFLYSSHPETYVYIINNIESFILFSANMAFHFNTEPMGIGHYWTLGVEFHFYIFFGALFLFINQKNHIAICLSVIFISILLRLYLWGEIENYSIYRLTFTRLDGFMCGFIVHAAVSQKIKVDIKHVYALSLGLFGLLIYCINDNQNVHTWFVQCFGYALFPMMWATVVWIVVHNENGILAKTLRNRILNWFGTNSYSMYIWHLIIIMIFKDDIKNIIFSSFETSFVMNNFIYSLSMFAISVAVGLILYKLIEEPFERLRQGKIKSYLNKKLINNNLTNKGIIVK